MDLFSISVVLNAFLVLIIFILLFLVFKYKKNILNLQNHINFLKTEIAKYEEKSNFYQELKNEHQNLLMQKNELLAEINELEKENATLKTKLIENEKAHNDKINTLKETFENLANEIFEKTQQKANQDIQILLTPLNQEIKEFKEKLQNLSKEEYSQINLLLNELKELKNLSNQLSEEANNLTKALKGDKKLQGIWGEVILEKVLELSGLKKGREYEREVVLKSSDKVYRPDVIIHLPNDRDIIIDSKVSLNAYAKYLETNDEKYLKEHVTNLKKHIDALADKNYENLEGINTLDFIFMFVALENALSDALNYDKDLYEYAFRKRVVLTSPTTLLSSLRAIEAVWRYERQNENIKEIIKLSDILYKKVRLFVEDFEKVGKYIEIANKNYENAKKRLNSDIVDSINKLKDKSGIKPKKEIGEIK